MSEFAERAYAHDRTIQKVDPSPVALPKRRPMAIYAAPSDSWERKTHEMVQAVVRISGAPVSHVQYVDEHTVVIWNHPAPWPEVIR